MRNRWRAWGLTLLGVLSFGGRASADPPPPLTVEMVSYRGWKDCIHLTNGQIELITPTVIGPRLVHFGFVGSPNEFHLFPDQIGQKGGTTWRSYGGHRLWHSPEANPRSYQPDNSPITAVMEGDTLHLAQPTEAATGIQKEMLVTMDRDAPHVRVLHRLTNRGLFPVTLAAWALSVMEQRGRAIIPLTHHGTKDSLLPNRAVVLWPYSNMLDPRVFWGKHYVLLKQDPSVSPAFKVGVTDYDGWEGYVRNGHLFLKRFTYEPDLMYPDYGASAESYVAGDFLELESVGPLRQLLPRQSLEYVEDWYLFQGADAQDEDAVDKTVLPHVDETNARQ